MAQIVCAVIIGLLNAFRGSGWLQQHGYNLAADLLKWLFIPLALFGSAEHFNASFYQAIVLTLPYYWFMITGTGACMQAYINNAINSTKGWPPFVAICDKLAYAILKIPPGTTPLPDEFYRLWGFIYATLVGIVFSLPFLNTIFAYGLPLWLFGITCRYLIWRKNEFLLLAFQSGLFFFSLT